MHGKLSAKRAREKADEVNRLRDTDGLLFEVIDKASGDGDYKVKGLALDFEQREMLEGLEYTVTNELGRATYEVSFDKADD